MRLLIVGNLEGYFGRASKIATDKGAIVRKADNIDIALATLRSGTSADLIMVDVKQDIAQFIKNLQLERIFAPIIACGIENDKNLAAQSIRDGAKEYVPLPPDEELISAILESISKDERKLIFASKIMEKIMALADQVAKSEATILITGKSGTGKEVMARYIHRMSKRKDKPFVSVNCAAIPDNLLESELFGHEKGAFTGAIARRIGKFEESSEGTLLLDEISEIDLKLQAKLLRAIQEREIDRIGGGKTIPLNLRILATSNRDLKKEVAEGRFREDLYFRLNIINIELPNLSERIEEIELFANYFITKYCNSNGFARKTLTDSALTILKNYSWPGNIRELENTIYRAVLLSPEGKINEENLGLRFSESEKLQQNNMVGRTMNSVEKELIESTLSHCLGDYIQAANILGISLKMLRTKLSNYEKEEELAC